MSEINNVMIENARLLFKNFTGNEGDFNPAGRRNFCVLLDHDLAERLKAERWNVRYLRPRDDQDDPQPYIQVTVNFSNKPPNIVLISSRGKSVLDEETVKNLDWAEMEKVDLIFSPYEWTVRGETGVKAYLKSMYVTIVEDELEKKYFDVPENDVVPIGDCICDECQHPCGSKGECRYD